MFSWRAVGAMACLAGVLVLVLGAAAPAGTPTGLEHARQPILAAYFAGPPEPQSTNEAALPSGSTGTTNSSGSTGSTGATGATGATGSTGTTGSGGASADWWSECWTVGWPDATALRIQKDVIWEVSAIESELGGQDGTVALCDGQDQFDVWVAPGPLDLAAATSAIDAIFVSALGEAEAEWLEARVEIASTPYSWTELDQTATGIMALISGEPTPSAWSVMAQVEYPYPLVEITLWNNRTDADVNAAQAIVSQYHGMVTLTLADSPPAPASEAASGVLSTVAPTLSNVHYLTVVRYDRHGRRAHVTITLAPGSPALLDVVVSVRSRSNVLLARKRLAQLATTTNLTLRLTAKPRHLVVTVRARTVSGGPILLHGKI